MNNKIVIVGLLIGFGGLLAWRPWNSSSDTLSTPQEVEVREELQSGMPRGALEVRFPKPVHPLPDTEAPLHLVIDELRSRSKAGEAGASCRLASELAFCAELPARRAELDRWYLERKRAVELISGSEARAAAEDSIDREMDFREGRVTKLASHCEKIDVSNGSELVDLWREAAIGGDPAAMKQYVSGSAFRMNDLLGSLRELETYKREAERIAIVGAERGDFDLVLLLAASHSPVQVSVRSLLAQVVEPDLSRSLALYRYALDALQEAGHADTNISREVEERVRELTEAATPDELMNAEEVLVKETGGWASPVIRGVDSLTTSGRFREVNRAWCGRE